MAVPKSRTSKKKTRQRKANWFAKANIQRERALTLGRSVLSEGEGSFIYNPDEEDDDEDDDEYEDDDEDDEEDDEAIPEGMTADEAKAEKAERAKYTKMIA